MPYFFSLVPIKEGGVNDLAADEAEAPADFAAPPSPCAPPLGCHPFLNVDILEVWLAVAGFGGGAVLDNSQPPPRTLECNSNFSVLLFLKTPLQNKSSVCPLRDWLFSTLSLSL